MDQTTLSQCHRCGAPLTDGVPGGLCAACFGGGLFAEEPAGLPFSRIGDYELLEEIGRGGMGLVYRARQISLGRAAAVKLILTGPLASVLERQRFVAEASAAAALEHPGIVSVYEAGEEDGQPFFAMQLIEGESLSARLNREPRFAPRAAAEFMGRVALAVQHAHERGFLHRDLKPGNILLDAQGAPHVTDFGLARRLDDESHLTLTGAAVGTPSYMAPEQTDTRQPPTTAVDVYSLGAILYELLSGQPPFQEKSLAELFVAIREKEPASISSVRSEVDRDLDVICRKCLEKEPARRYRTAQALADDLQHWLNGEPITARAVGKTERLWRWCRRRPAVAGLAAAAVVLLLAGTAGILWQWQRANREADHAKEALRQAEESLWQANSSEARARRISRERGQRREALRLLQAAAAYRPDMTLRNEAIAALALPDLSEPRFFPELPGGGTGVFVDRAAQRVAYVADSGEVQVCRLETAESVAVIQVAGAKYIAPDRDLQRLVVFGDKETAGRHAELWSLAGGAPVKVMEYAGTSCADFSGDGEKLLLCRGGNRMELRAAKTGALLAATEAPPAVRIAVSPGGQQAVLWTANATAAELWSLDPPARLKLLPPLPEALSNVTWHPTDGTLFLCCDNKVLHVRPLWPQTEVIATHQREGAWALVHPSGQFVASTSWDGVVRFTAPGLGSELLRTVGFRQVSFSSDGRRFVVWIGKRAGVCDVVPPDVWRCLPVPADEQGGWSALSFSPDSRWLAVTGSEGASFYDPVTLERRARQPLREGTGGAWISSERYVVSAQRAGLSQISLTSTGGQLSVHQEEFPGSPASAAVFESVSASPDGMGLLCTGGNSVLVYDPQQRSLLSAINDVPMLRSAAWSPDRRWIATGYWNNQLSGGSEARVYTPDGTLVVKLPSGSCVPAFTPDGQRLIVGSTHEYVEWETGTWRELRRHAHEASGLEWGLTAFSAAANLMALQASESVIRLLRLDTGAELARLEQPAPARISLMALSPDGRWLAVQMHQSVRLWDVQAMRRSLREIGLDWD